MIFGPEKFYWGGSVQYIQGDIANKFSSGLFFIISYPNSHAPDTNGLFFRHAERAEHPDAGPPADVAQESEAAACHRGSSQPGLHVLQRVGQASQHQQGQHGRDRRQGG